MPDVDLDGQWAVVDAFLAAARAGDFDRLLAILDPDVVLRSDGGMARPDLISLVRGARAIAEQAMDLPSVCGNVDADPRERDTWGHCLGARRESICDPGPNGQGWEDRRDRRARGSGAAWQAGSHRGRWLSVRPSFRHPSSGSHIRAFLRVYLCSAGMNRRKRTQEKELRT